MKAFAIETLGEPGSVREIDVPAPGEGELRIRVAAAGLNPFDSAVIHGYMNDRMEHRFPLVPGMDASGTVEALGEGVAEFAVGDEVFGSVGKPYLGGGTLAEMVTMSAKTVARKPVSLEHAAAAALPVAGVTALVLVDAIAPAQGDIVIALGATGGVGGYLVQIATQRGARVVAVCSGANAEYAGTLGAVEVLDYDDAGIVEAMRSRHPGGIRGVADMHGDRDQVARFAELVGEGGHIASAVGAADTEALEKRGIGATNVYGMVTRERLERLVSLIEAKELAVPELNSYPLSEAAEALEAVGSGHVRGKIVVTPA